jgi:hypothetical protein
MDAMPWLSLSLTYCLRARAAQLACGAALQMMRTMFRPVLLAVAVVLLTVGQCAAVDEHAPVNFEPLRSKILFLLQDPPQPPCRYPEGAIMVTYSNAHTFKLLVLQRRALELNHMRECVERRFVTVCLDAKCNVLCEEHGIPHCVDLNIRTAPSDFFTADYTWITYMKHEVLEAAVQVATEAFFFDTDTCRARSSSTTPGL